MTWRLEHSNQHANPFNGNGPRSIPSKTQDSRHESSQSAYQLLAFKKSIKREVSHYTILKDEKYFEAFKRNLLVTVTTHNCEEVLDGAYQPDNNRDSHEI